MELEGVKAALELFKTEYGRYPTAEEGLKILINPPDRTPYLYGGEQILLDPWRNPIIYRLVTPSEVLLKSTGPDGKEGTNDDINLD